ncbi:MAG TPA: hypothetical protein VJ866_14265 [Pyrinomonadaceae bacterium]|nr:hypothetical protein [Pyrinomonadaceae bacterium]
MQKELLEWAQTRFWIIAVLAVFVGFFGVRALVREMIASELRDATRAAAQAQAAAEHTKEVTKDVRADADKYRETVLQLSEAADKVDERFKALDARINAEGAHAIAASELQLAQLAGRIEELSEVVKSLASESQENRKLLQDYEARVNALNKVAASKRETFSENSKYQVIVVSHPKNEESKKFGRQLTKLLTERGYRASSGLWGEKHPASFNKIDLHYKSDAPELATRLREITAELVGRLKPDTPIKVIEGPDVTVSKSDAVIFLTE